MHCAFLDTPSTLLSPNLCPRRLTCMDYINPLSVLCCVLSFGQQEALAGVLEVGGEQGQDIFLHGILPAMCHRLDVLAIDAYNFCWYPSPMSIFSQDSAFPSAFKTQRWLWLLAAASLKVLHYSLSVPFISFKHVPLFNPS